MLRTTPEAAREAQPFVRGAFSIVADLRLDNRDELARALDLDPTVTRAAGDAELVIRAYGRWGVDCVKKFRGDFAFSIWDGFRRRLFCARDPFGARPFVYASLPRLFVFGSEVKAILAVPEVPRVLNEQRVGDFLVEGYHEGFDAEVTFLRDVLRLPPAHTLTVDGAGARIQRYWSLLSSRGPQVRSPREAVEGFRDLLAGAVGERLRGGAAVGSMLSGGLDSSIIVAMAARIRRARGEPPLPTFSCLEDDAVPSRESDYIRLASGLPGLAPTFIEPRDVGRLGRAFDLLRDTLDDPFDLMPVPLLVYQAAADAGLTSVLDGVDGDLVASRNGSMRYALQHGRWRVAWREARQTARWERSPRWRILLEQGVRPALRGLAALTPLERYRHAGRRRWRRYRTTGRHGYVRRAFADRIDLEGRTRRVLDRVFPAGWSLASPDEEYARWLECLIPAALERYDRTAASQGIEPRHPLLDVRLVEFYLRVPWDSPANQGLPKAILRQAAAEHLPSELYNRLYAPPPHGAFTEAIANLKGPEAWKIIDAERVGEFVDLQAMRAFRPSGERDRAEHERAVVRIGLLAAWLERIQRHAQVGGERCT
jgi:asparagine synthase (glutamine-hydrolysing)